MKSFRVPVLMSLALVVVEAIIDEDGCVRYPRVLHGAGKRVDAAAVDAMKQWVFLPAIQDGRPVRVFYVLTVGFK